MALFFYLACQAGIFIKLQVQQGQIFQLCLHQGHTEAPREWRVNFVGLTRFILLLAWIHDTQCAHIVQAISQLQDDNPRILGHCQQHLAHCLGPLPTFQFAGLERALFIIPKLLTGGLFTLERAVLFPCRDRRRGNFGDERIKFCNPVHNVGDRCAK